MSDPAHPAVDWSRVNRIDGRLHVHTTCPICGDSRWTYAPEIRRRIREGSFTGCCYKDRLVHKARADRLPRLEHPAVDWDDTRIVATARQRHTRVAITCPSCGKKRYVQPGATAAKIREGGNRFTGLCLPCSPKAHKREWIILGPGRAIEPDKGYVRLTAEAISPEDRQLFDAMRGRATYLMEHRFVMARILGRPLTSTELVDHMDGIKTNNDPANLRVYRRGRNEPGDTTGYGTYYHEWQLALARIAELELVCQLRSPPTGTRGA